jgi:hypothetical protein
MTTFEVEFEFEEKENSHGLRSGEYGGFGTTGITFLVKTSVVMQHPNVSMPNSSV